MPGGLLPAHSCVVELIWDGAGGVVAVRPRLRDRIGVRLHAERIDRRLALDGSPEESIENALRGRALTDPQTRRRLASGIERAIAHATDGAVHLLPVDRDRVRRALPELVELRDRLDSDSLPSARGMARARLLLTDGTGPLYNRDTSLELRDTIRVVLDGFAQR
jgi:hypothetical protein